ncbi:hypothetical protein [Methanobrevibacter sp.]|uniref:hypothetical protein n=1 Tax=Methanobrevibacter sp. TaxID=66852 RepID=UPI00386BA99A
MVNNIKDLDKKIENKKIKVIPLKKNSKIPKDSDYYNNNYTLDILKKHDGNFGIIAGANHKDSSIAIIDIDGYKLNDESDDKVAKVKQETATFIFNCLKSIPGAMHVRTQSGGYHIYLWNKTVADKIHDTSKNLYFPEDYKIAELGGKSLSHAIEIFTKEGTKQCVLPGSTILDEATGKINNYTIISNINKLSDIATVEDINAVVKDTLVAQGFTYNESKLNCESIVVNDDNLKALSNDEVKQVASLLIPILKSIDGSKHYGSLCFGGYFSKNITKKSAEAICDAIIDEISGIFTSSNDFKKTVLNNYSRDFENKTGLPTLVKLVKERNNTFNSHKFIFEMNKICKKHFKHKILSTKHSENKIKYLSINYSNNTISTQTWNQKEDKVFYTNIHDVLNFAPISIHESYNILDNNASPQLCLTFYRNGMPTKQTIKGDDIESLEKQLARRPGIVLKPKEYKGVLNEVINEYIKLEQIEITEEIPVEGIFINPITGKLCRRDDRGNTEIKKPSKEAVQEALAIWALLKNVYPGDKKKLAHILRFGLICPFSYILKTLYDWIRWLYLYGPSRTSKTTLAEIALCPYTALPEEISIGGGSFDTPYRIGKALSRHGMGVIVNEPSPKIEEGEQREIIKRSVESKYSREKEEKGEHKKIPAYSNIIFTANSFIPTHDAFVRRSQYLEFTKDDRLSDKDVKNFKETFHHKNWSNTDFLKLRAIGDFIVWYVSENFEVLGLEYADIINSMLDALLEYAEEDKDQWDWMYHDAELMDIGSADNEVVNQFRRKVLHDYKHLTRTTYLSPEKNETEEHFNERYFKNVIIEGIQQNKIDYLHYQNGNIIVNTSVKAALNEFCGLQVTCKGLAGYMDCKYITINYKGQSIKGFKLSYDDFKKFLDKSG